MRKVLTVLFSPALICSNAPAFAGSMSLLGSGKPPAIASYAGPNDVSNTWAYWYGFRGFSSTDTSPAANVCLPSGGACFDITLSNGSPVIPAVLSTCNTSTVICTVKTMYEKSGANTCASAPCNATNATQANQPVFVPSCQNGLPCMKCLASSSTLLIVGSANAATRAIPFSVSSVYERTPSTSTVGVYFGVGGILAAGGGSATDTHFISSFTNTNITGATDLSAHAIETVFNDNSSTVMVDGSSIGAAPGGASQSFNDATRLFEDQFGNFFTGLVMEAGSTTGDFTSIRSSLNTQQHAFWNF